MDTLPVYIQYLLAALVIMVCRLTTLSCAHLLWLWLSMAVPIEKKKKTKWFVTLTPLKHVSKFVSGPYFRPKRDFLLPFSDMKWWCPYEAKKMPNSVCWFKRAQTSPYFRPERFKSSPNFRPKKVQTHTLWRYAYRKIPKIFPEAYIFQGPFWGAYFWRGLYSAGLIYGGKFAL